MRLTLPVSALSLGLLLGSPLQAQDPADPFAREPSSAGIVLDSVRVAIEWRPEWRGYLLGTGAVTGFADIGLLGYPISSSGTWGLSGHLHGTKVFDPGSASISTGHAGGGLGVARYFRGGEGTVGLVADAYWLPHDGGSDNGLEVGLRLAGVEWDWGREELLPVLGFGVYRDFSQFDGWRAEADFNFGFGVQNVAFWVFNDVSAWIEATGWWTDYSETLSPRDDFGGRYGVGASLDQGLVAVIVRLGRMHPLDASAKGHGEFALRIWPDGRNR